SAAILFWHGNFADAKPAIKAKNPLRPLQITGQLQIRYVDGKGAHVQFLDARHYLDDELPSDAEITVLGGDALFECGGAQINAISGTIFSAGEAKGREYLFVKQGELSIEIDGKIVTLDRDRHSFSFPKVRRQVDSKG